MSAAIGIDLGTTNTVVAVCEGGETRVLADAEGQTLLPSVVSFHPDGSLLVGRPARRRRVIDARNTVHSIKRLIGRMWGSNEVEHARASFAFDLQNGPQHQPVVVARGNSHPLPSISAMVLKRAKEIAEQSLGEPVKKAVITVPASFNDLQRAATKKAAKETGLEVLRILNEPTAAALAYGVATRGVERLAIYDFGGGTFDLTLLELSDGVVEVIATAGDSFLGGDDIDQALEREMATSLVQQTGLDASGSVELLALLRAAGEHLKIQLSTVERAHVDLKSVGYGLDGVPIDFHYELTRAQLERVARPFVDKTLAVCAAALHASKLEVGAFSQIILVGGSTRMPLVSERVETFFSKRPRTDWNPDEVVAVGAAILAAMLTGAPVERSRALDALPQPPLTRPRIPLSPALPSLLTPEPMPVPAGLPARPRPLGKSIPAPPNVLPEPPTAPLGQPAIPSVFPIAPEGHGPLLIDVTPLTLSIDTVGGYIDRIVPANTSVPCSRRRSFATSVENQTEVVLRVCQGESDRYAQNAPLGELVLTGLRAKRRGEVSIEVTFELDVDGMLNVRARDEETGREISAQMRVGGAA